MYIWAAYGETLDLFLLHLGQNLKLIVVNFCSKIEPISKFHKYFDEPYTNASLSIEFYTLLCFGC